MGLKVLACVCLLTLAQRGYVTLADDSDLTYPLDGIKEFRIEHEGAGDCIDDEGKLSSCEENKDRNLWRWEQRKLINVKSKKCLLYVHKQNIIVDDCRRSIEDAIENQWTCIGNKIFTSGKLRRALKSTSNRHINGVADGEHTSSNQGGSTFNVYIKSPTRPRLMICALWYDMGKRTNDPNYYFFKNEDLKITWPTKYVKFYVIVGQPMFQGVLARAGKAKVDAAIQELLVGGISSLDKEYRRMNIRILLTGYEVWKYASPIKKTRVYHEEKAEIREYSFNVLRKKYDYDSCIYGRGGLWLDSNGKLSKVGGAGMGGLCGYNETRPRSEMFIMAHAMGYQERFTNIISHEFGHELFQGHNFEPSKPCPFYHMFGKRCTMGGNDKPRGYSVNMLRVMRIKDRYKRIDCANAKPNLQKIQKQNICGNGIRDPGEECDCGSSQACLTSHPCCDGMICRLKAGAECSNEKCCSNCKRQTTGKCEGNTVTLNDLTGAINLKMKAYNIYRHWRVISRPGGQTVLQIQSSWFDFHINCSYDYIEVRDGGDKSAKPIGKYCNQANFPPFILSTSKQLFITFNADATFPSKFGIKYFTVDMFDNVRQGNFEINYKIRNSPKTVQLCDGKTSVIQCEYGMWLRVINAMYGNLNETTCAASGGSQDPKICIEPSSRYVTKQLCDDKRVCQLSANSSIYGNKCNGPQRSLEVTYQCSRINTRKACLTYSAHKRRLETYHNETCSNQFRWLDNNILYHVESNRCLNSNLRLTHNCYSASNAQFKLLNGKIRTTKETCWVLNGIDVIAGSCFDDKVLILDFE